MWFSGGIMIDWFQIITDLKNAGISGREIARRLNVSVSTVVMWKNGSSPSYEVGAKLIAIWEKEKNNKISHPSRVRAFR